MIALSPVWSWVFVGLVIAIALVLGLALSRMSARDEDHMSQRWLEKQVLAEWRQDSEAGDPASRGSSVSAMDEHRHTVSEVAGSKPAPGSQGRTTPASELYAWEDEISPAGYTTAPIYDEDDVAIGAVLALYDQDSEAGGLVDQERKAGVPSRTDPRSGLPVPVSELYDQDQERGQDA